MSINYLSIMLNSNAFLNALTKVGTILLALLVLLLMITIHELGHYTFGKLLKFKINEFAVGFGKAIYSRTNKSGEKISLRVIPLGGYCAFEGEDENSENPDAFNNQAPWKRLIVLFGGVLFNFISAIIFSVILLAVIGSGAPKVQTIEGPNTAILQQNDVILEIDGTKPTFLNGGLPRLTSDVTLGENVVLLVERDGEKIELIVQKHTFIDLDPITSEETETVRFGITTSYKNYTIGESLLKAVPYTFEMAWECLVILGQLLTGEYGLRDIGGPITTINVIADASAASMLNLLLLIPLIAVNLAVFNILPIPALDGARMLFVLIEWIRKKPIKRELEAKIHMVGLIVLFSLVIIIDMLHLLIF